VGVVICIFIIIIKKISKLIFLILLLVLLLILFVFNYHFYYYYNHIKYWVLFLIITIKRIAPLMSTFMNYQKYPSHLIIFLNYSLISINNVSYKIKIKIDFLLN
jgi:hypothetical protein